MVHFVSIFSFTIFLTLFINISADRERDSWKNAKLDPYTPKCISIMSEETLRMYNEDYKTADNDEIRAFYVCMLENAGYMKADKIIVNEIMKDFEKYYQPNSQGRKFGSKILKTCNNEAETEMKRTGIAGRFVKCIMEQVASEI